MSGTSTRSRFDGRWVNTMVFTRPKRFASHPAERAEMPGQDVGPEEDRAQRGLVGAEPRVEPEGHEALHHEAAGEGVEREERREPEDHLARPVQAEPWLEERRPVVPAPRRRRLHGGAEPGEEEEQRGSQHRVAQHHRAVGGERAWPARDCSPCERSPPASDPSAVAKEPASAYQEKIRVRSSAGIAWEQRRLLDGQEGADLVAGRADDPDGGGRGAAPRTTWWRRRGGRPRPSSPRPGAASGAVRCGRRGW